jgi:hypothetical protein
MMALFTIIGGKAYNVGYVASSESNPDSHVTDSGFCIKFIIVRVEHKRYTKNI